MSTICSQCYRGSEQRSWYPVLKDFCFKTKIVDVPNDFMEYFESDESKLPNPLTTNYSEILPGDRRRGILIDTLKEGCEVSPFSKSLSETEPLIHGLLEDYECKAFVKLDGKSPRDASWINAGSFKVCNVGDFCTLLKASDMLREAVKRTKSLNNLMADEFKHTLSIQPWKEVSREMEFRVFIRNNQVVGISQKHTDEVYKVFDDDISHNVRSSSGVNSKKTFTEVIFEVLSEFVKENVIGKLNLKNLAVDVYFPRAWEYYQSLLSLFAEHEQSFDDSLSLTAMKIIELHEKLKKIYVFDVEMVHPDVLDMLLFDFSEIYGENWSLGMCCDDLPIIPTVDSIDGISAVRTVQSNGLKSGNRVGFQKYAAHAMPDDFVLLGKAQMMLHDQSNYASNVPDSVYSEDLGDFYKLATQIKEVSDALEPRPTTMNVNETGVKNRDSDADVEEYINSHFDSDQSTNPQNQKMMWEKNIERMHMLGMFRRGNESSDNSDSD